jgi:hypothetical protein
MKQLILCIYGVSIALLMGCAGNPPSVVNFMDSEYIRSVKVSAWTGDVVMEDADTVDGPHILEQPAEIGVGIYTSDSIPLKLGLEFETFGVNILAGLKNENIGVLTWVNASGKITGGVAIAQQFRITQYNSIGAFEYISKNSIGKFDQTEIGRISNGYKTYGEYGLGLYFRQYIFRKISMAIETRYGNQINSYAERYYIGLNVNLK